MTNIYGKQRIRRGAEYTLEEFHNMFLYDKKFDRLYKEWVKSNYSMKYKPTIDRINTKKGYTKRNIQCMSWRDNRYKQRMELKFTRARKVCQISDGKIVKIYLSQRIAVKETGFSQGNLSECLSGKRKMVNGYEWQYYDDYYKGISTMKIVYQ